MLHKSIVLGDQHIIHNWEYANAAARTGATGFTSADLYKVALQLDTKTLYILTAITPTWDIIGASAGTLTSLQDQINGRTVMSGFPVDTSGNYLTTLTYNETTRTVTITPTGATFKVYSMGVEYIKTGAQSIVHSATQGNNFVYYDETGTLVTSTTSWDLLKHAPVCFIIWDATNSRGIPFEERHHAGRDVYWHRNQHAAEGTKTTSGFGISGYTLTDGSVDTAVTFAIATGRVEDEDIRVDTVALADNGPYTIMERVGAAGDWQITRSFVLPFFHAANVLKYNQNTGATWQRTSVTEDYFVNYYVCACTSLPNTDITPTPGSNEQIIIFPGQVIYSTQGAASAESIANLSWGTAPFQEVAPLYQITLRYNATNPGAYTNTARCAIYAVSRIVGTNASITQFGSIDHGALSGLADDDHLQYALTSGSTRVDINASSPTNGHVLTYDSGTGKFIPSAPSGSTATLTNQTTHGFTAGNAIYFNGTIWVKAKADAANTLAFSLVSSVVDANNFYIQSYGTITGLSGLTSGQYYYVSAATAGTLTSTEPTTGYSNPILFALSTTSGVVLPFRPSLVGGLDSSEYTAASTACTGAITTAATWSVLRIGKMVTLRLPATTGTASVAAIFDYGVVLPAEYRPTGDLAVTAARMTNGGALMTAPGMIYITSSTGKISVYRDGSFATNYTAGSSAGINTPSCITWRLP